MLRMLMRTLVPRASKTIPGVEAMVTGSCSRPNLRKTPQELEQESLSAERRKARKHTIARETASGRQCGNVRRREDWGRAGSSGSGEEWQQTLRRE